LPVLSFGDMEKSRSPAHTLRRLRLAEPAKKPENTLDFRCCGRKIVRNEFDAKAILLEPRGV
jgi:hypothetical protein